MKRSFILSFALLCFLPVALRAQDNTPLPWKSFPEALEEARQTGKKTLVFIYTDWCPWCQKIQQEVFPDSLISAAMQQAFVLTKLNAESDEIIRFMGEDIPMKQLALALGGEGFPTITFLTSDGKYITRLPGYVPADVFRHVLDFVAEEAYATQSFEDFMASRNQ